MAKGQEIERKQIAIVNLFEAQNIPGISGKTIVAKDNPGLTMYEGEFNSVIIEQKGKPTSKICHIKSIVYK